MERGNTKKCLRLRINMENPLSKLEEIHTRENLTLVDCVKEALT